MSSDIAMVTRQYQVGNRQWLLSAGKYRANVTCDITKWASSPTNQVQTVTISGSPTGGTFTLSFGGVLAEDPTYSPTLPYNATAAQVAAAIANLPYYGPNETLLYVGASNVTVTGPTSGVYTVTFGGALAGANVPALVATASFTGGTSPAIATAISTAAQPGLTPNGYIPSGTALGKVTSTGMVGPYDPNASDGRQTAYGFLFDDVRAIRFDGSTASQVPTGAIVNEAVVSLSHLPVQTGPGSIDSNGKAALAQIRFEA